MKSLSRKSSLAIVLVLLLIAGFVGWWFTVGGNGAGEALPYASGAVETSAQVTVEADVPVGQLAQEYLSDAAPSKKPVASESGKIYGYPVNGEGSTKSYSGSLEVLAVEAGEESTHVRYSLAAEEEIRPDIETYNAGGDVGLESPEIISKSEDLRLSTGTWTASPQHDCTCAWLPSKISPDPIELSILYPVLPDSVTEVQFTMPGFDPITAPVTRD